MHFYRGNPVLAAASAAVALGSLAHAATLAKTRGLAFEPNRGQAAAEARFLARTGEAMLSFLADGFTLRSLRGQEVKMSLLGARRRPVIAGRDARASRSNYILGSAGTRRIAGVPHFAKLEYRDVYPGIDLVFYGAGGELEYDFVLAPGTSPDSIRLRYDGAREMRVELGGDLLLETAGGLLRQKAPKVYQEVNGSRIAVEARHRITASREVGFELGSFNRSIPVVIDPVLTYASYIGGTSSETAEGIAIDSAGNMYLTGITMSSNFPLGKSAFRNAYAGEGDIYVSKFNSAGEMVYSTFIGGSGFDASYSIKVDSQGSAVVCGATDSANFPLKDPLQEANRGGYLGVDALVSKLNPAGTDLVFSTYWGGNDDDLAKGLALDLSGNIYIAGLTTSQNFPVGQPAYQVAIKGGISTFVTKFTPTGNRAIYSTLVGGTRYDSARAIAVDKAGAAYVTGYTSSLDFPNVNGFQTSNRGGTTNRYDAFLYKLAPSGASLEYSSYLGGSGEDEAYAIAVDDAGNAYVAGKTESTDFPTGTGALQKQLSGTADAFLSKVSPTGKELAYSTYFGGTREDRGFALAVEPAGAAYLAGDTTSSNLTMVNAIQSRLLGPYDAFVAKFNAAGNQIEHSTYIGGAGSDTIWGVALDANKNLHFIGDVDSTDFPVTPNAFQRTNAGKVEAVFGRIAFGEESTTFSVSPTALEFRGTPDVPIAAKPINILAQAGGKPVWSVDLSVTGGGDWLAASPRTGTGTATVDVTVNAGKLAPGNYQGTVTVSNKNVPSNKTTIAVTLVLQPPSAQVPPTGVVNAASFLGGPVAPGEMVTIFGQNFGPPSLSWMQLSGGLVGTALGETRVLFDKVAAPLIYAVSGQVTAMVPYGVAGKQTTQMQVEYKSLLSNPVNLDVAESAPALFTANSSGKGQGAFLNEDLSPNSSSNPARKGTIVILYGTGEGQTDPVGVDGKPAIDTLPKPKLPVTVRIGGVDAEVLYVGAAPSNVAGVMQLNVRVPEGVASGAAPVIATIGGKSSQTGVTVALE